MTRFVSYAQNFEDVMLWRALREVERGFYVDVGAHHPLLESVTAAFYRRGWRGINLEPAQPYFDLLAQARPEDVNLPVAAARARGTVTLHQVAGTGLSTRDGQAAERHRSAGFDVTAREVAALPLDAVLAEHASGVIHFLKIDVEGDERCVLEGLDLQRFRPWILLIEATRPMSQEENHQAWEPRVLGAAYRFVYEDGLNRFYLAAEHDQRAAAFRFPPNVFDDFVSNADEAFALRALEYERREVLCRERLRAQADEIARLGAEQAEAAAALAAAQAGIAALAIEREAAEQQCTALSTRLLAATHERTRLAEQLGAVAAHNRALLAALAGLRSSSSWRITAPLRAAMRVTAGLRRRTARGTGRLLRGAVARLLPLVIQLTARTRSAAAPQVRAAGRWAALEARVRRAARRRLIAWGLLPAEKIVWAIAPDASVLAAWDALLKQAHREPR